MMRRVAILLLIILAVVGMSTSLAAAQGIGVTPGLQEVELRDGEREVSFEVTVANTTSTVAEFRVSTVDFGALDESGGVAFLGRSGQEAYAYSLSQWMRLEKTELRIESGQTEMVTVTVENSNRLSPGGHYGAVLVTAKETDQLQNDAVAMLPGASTLVLLKKIGGEQPALELDSIKTNSSLLRMPSNASLRFHNEGNIHLVPRGIVELSGPFGSEVARGIINETSAYILPETYRIYDTSLNFSRQPWLPGRYTLSVQWRYDGVETFETHIYHHWYIGRAGIIMVVILSLLIVLYLFVAYKRRPVTRN